MRILVVSENLILMRNLREWFDRKIKSGHLIIDHVTSTKDAEPLLQSVAYDNVFHNGIYIIPAVERYQSGAGIWNFGQMNNNYQNTINVNDKKSFSRIINKKYLQNGVNIGSVFAILTIITAVITWGVSLRADVDDNIEDIGRISTAVTEIRVDQKVFSKDLNKLVVAFEYVYGDKIKEAENKNLDK